MCIGRLSSARVPSVKASVDQFSLGTQKTFDMLPTVFKSCVVGTRKHNGSRYNNIWALIQEQAVRRVIRSTPNGRTLSSLGRASASNH